MRIILLSIFVSCSAFGSTTSVYQITVDLEKGGKKVSSSSIIVQEGQEASIKNLTSEKDGITLDAKVTAKGSDALLLDYRLKDKTGEKSIEVAKTAVELKLGSTEKSELKDSGGTDLRFRITVKQSK